MVDLAESSPESPAARAALLWVINQPARADFRAYGDQFARAVALLVRHHGDDPEAVRIGLGLDNWVTPRRDAPLSGVLRCGQGPRGARTGAAGAVQYLATRPRKLSMHKASQAGPRCAG